LNLKDGCSASKDSVLPDYEKLHFESFEDFLFGENVKRTVRLGVGWHFLIFHRNQSRLKN
jgi:hypothetical protein